MRDYYDHDLNTKSGSHNLSICLFRLFLLYFFLYNYFYLIIDYHTLNFLWVDPDSRNYIVTKYFYI